MGRGFAAYCRHRVLNADPAFRNDHVYLAFLLLVKEHIELKRSISVYFRQARKTPDLTIESMQGIRYHSLERYGRTFTAFKNIRGTAMYFQAVKKNLMATIRQKGCPTHFITLSAAEWNWKGLLKSLYETVTKTEASDEVIANLTTSEKNTLISQNVVQTTIHFHKRLEKIMPQLQKRGFLQTTALPNNNLSKNYVKNVQKANYFYRIEFQARGAPHAHILLWARDENGEPPPTFTDITEENFMQKTKEIEDYHDGTICCSVPAENECDEELHKDVRTYQNHYPCKVGCFKKKKCLTIQANEGHGKLDGLKEENEMFQVPLCRYRFPRIPMAKTKLIFAFSKDDDKDMVKHAKVDFLKIKKYIIRQTFAPVNAKLDNQKNWQEFKKSTFEDYLEDVGMFFSFEHLTRSEQYEAAIERYEKAIRASVKGTCAIYPKRDTKDVFTNNYNNKLMTMTKANHDIQLCTDPYATAQYVADYCSKNESGLSIFCKKIEEECSNLNAIDKLRKFATALDKNRELSMQELIWRLQGLPMSKFSIKVKYINCSHPHHRDGLVNRNLQLGKDCFYNLVCDDDEDDEDANSTRAFHMSKHEYYEKRPHGKYTMKDSEEVDFELMCLADWLSEFDHFTTKKYPRCEEMPEKKMGYFVKRQEPTVLRYYLRYDDEVEFARGLCVLFYPFRDEMRDVHNHDPLQLYNNHKDMIETNRKKYEHKSKINELIKSIDKEKEEKMEETDDEEDYIDEDTSTEQEREIHDAEVGAAFDKQAAIKSLPKEDKNYIYLTIEELTKRVRSLNPQQRRIFDDIIERLSDPNVENKPFYLYLAGEAGTGKSYLVKTIIAAVKHINKKSGKNELEKPSVLVMATHCQCSLSHWWKDHRFCFSYAYGKGNV